MPILTELIVSVVGGVLTAVILSMFSRGSRAGGSSVRADVTLRVPPPPRQRSAVGDFFRIIVSVIGGIAVAMVLGRILIQAGLLPRGLPTRLGLLIAGTALFWLLLSGIRRR